MIFPNYITNYYTQKPSKRPNFHGYDARKLEAVVMNINKPELVSDMAKIGKKSEFRVFCAKFKEETRALMGKDWDSSFSVWGQDMATITPQKKVLCREENAEFANFLEKKFNLASKTNCNYKAGGNFFYVSNDGREELLMGANCVKGTSISVLKKIYGVDRIHFVPQMDFHLDLFVRPLDKKKILVADDELTLKCLEKMHDKAKELRQEAKNNRNLKLYLKLTGVYRRLKGLLTSFQAEVRNNNNPQTKNVSYLLKKAGFEPVSVPGRIYSITYLNGPNDLTQELNYMNALVNKKEDGTLVYITNKSRLNRQMGINAEISKLLGTDFEKMFTESIKEHVAPQNVYFVDVGELLCDRGGGIHCLVSEVPKFS